MFANSLRQGVRGAARASARSFTSSARPLSPSLARSTILATTLATSTLASVYAYQSMVQSPIMLEGEKTIAGEKGTAGERSFIMIKPDGVSRQLVGKIVSRFEERGYKLVAIKSLTPSDALAKEHYIDLASKPFYKSLVAYITSGTPVVAMVWEGKDVIRQGRVITGTTNPQTADPGSVRGQYAVSIGRNLIHGSDSHEAATKEIGLWFAESELVSAYEPAAWSWVMADN